MKKKRLLIVALTVALVSCLTLAVTQFSVKAEAETLSSIENKANGVEFIKGAQLRVDEEDDGITSARFEAVIDSELYNSLISGGAYVSGAEMGFSIVPEFAFEDFAKSTGFTDYFEFFASLGNEKPQISSVIKPSEIYPYKKLEAQNGEATYTKYIVRAVITLKEEHYSWKYRAFVYYVLDGKTYYSDLSDARSVVCVSDAVLGSEEYKANLTDTQIAKIEKITAKHDDVIGHILDENGACTVCGEKTQLSFDSIEEFSAVTSLPKLIESVTIDLTGKTVDLTKSPVIGNEKIADNYSVKKLSELSEEEKSLIVEERTGSNDVILNTAKKSFTLTVKNGTMVGTDVSSLSDSKAGFVVKVPDGCDVLLENVTFNKAINVSAGWNESFASTVRVHKRKNFTFKNCKFESAALIRDGHFATENLTFDGCSFTLFENAKSDNERNPLWIQNIGKCNVTIKNCKFETVRPIKVIENDFVGATLTVINNEFTLSDDAKNKNVAIYFPDKGEGLGNVLIEGNTLSGGTALIAFRGGNITLSDGAKFEVNENELNGALLSVEWYKDTLYLPDFVTGRAVTENLVDLLDDKDAFAYGNSVNKDLVINGNGIIVKKWQDLWVSGKITVKNVVFAQGVTFNANADEAGVALENCAFYACDYSRITADHKLNSGAGYCLDFETCGKNNLVYSVTNSTMAGENDTSVYADFYETPMTRWKKRGHAVALDMVAGKQTATTVNYSLTIDNCIIDGVRGNAVQLYGANVGAIVIKNTKINSWGVNCGTKHDGETAESAAIRGDYALSGDKTISIENVTFGLDEGGLLKHINVGEYEGNTDGAEKAGTYSVVTAAGEEIAEKINAVASGTDTIKAIVNGGTVRLKDKTVKTGGKEVVLIGRKDAKYDATTTASASPDGSFANANAIFKNMTIDFGVQDFNGFVNASNLEFDDCTINGMMTYNGKGKAIFNNCKFYSKDYNLWLYEATSFAFKDCYFQSDIGKYLNGYRQQAPSSAIEFVLENCTFEPTDKADKKPVYIKSTGGAEWNVTVTNVTYQGKNSKTEGDKSFFYTLASNTFKSTTITIDGIVVVKDGKVV